MSFLLPIIFASILSIVFVLSNRFIHMTEKYHEYMLSLGSGMLLAIIFAEAIPVMISEGSALLSPEAVSIGILVGFVGYHLIERYTYKHVRSTKELTKELGYLHVGGFFVDNFLEGFIIVLLFGLATIQNYMLFILFVPLLLRDIVASVTLKHITERFRLGKLRLALLSLSIVFGAIVGLLLNLQSQNFYIALAVITGIIIYFVTRDELPRGRKGSPAFFLIGLAIVLLLFSSIGMIIG